MSQPLQKAISCQYNEAESMELLQRSHVGNILLSGKGGEGWGKDIIHRTEARQERTLGQSQKWTGKKTGSREGDKKGNCLFKVRSDEGPGKIKTSRAQKLRFFKIKNC